MFTFQHGRQLPRGRNNKSTAHACENSYLGGGPRGLLITKLSAEHWAPYCHPQFY